MVIFEIFKSPCMDLPFRTLIAPGIGSMDPVSFWPFLLVTGCCEQFYSHLVVLYIEECQRDWTGARYCRLLMI